MSDTIKDYIEKKLQPLLSIFAQAALGKFPRDIEIPDEEDEFAELYSGVQIMLNVIHQEINSLEGEIVNRKKVQAELSRNQLELKAILEHIGDGLIVTDKEGNIVIINHIAEEMLGWGSKELIGKSLVTSVRMEDEERHIIPFKSRPMTLTLTSGKKITGIYWYRRRDNTLFPTAIVATPLFVAEKIVGSIQVFRDVTQERELETQKDNFIALASHEMKTPVTSLKMFSQFLQKRLKKKGDTELIPQLKSMDKQLIKLNNLVNDLLDASRLKQGKLKYYNERFSIDRLIRETVNNIQKITQTHKLVIDRRAKQIIIADRARIEQVLINLINNAIKYSPQADRIVIGASTAKDLLTVSVQDFGLGIPKKEQKGIFGRFYQVDNPELKTYPGLGLGLYISATIIKRHNGDMWVESQEAKGSTFFFTIPIKGKRR